MNWTDAVAAMRQGVTLRRSSEIFMREVASDVYETGEEGATLLHAWSVDNFTVCVFIGSSSRAPFIPSPIHLNALDWEIQ